ncbi:MAG: outer membrane protein assembly factor BamA [Candidatus Brocadiia bacterium]
MKNNFLNIILVGCLTVVSFLVYGEVGNPPPVTPTPAAPVELSRPVTPESSAPVSPTVSAPVKQTASEESEKKQIIDIEITGLKKLNHDAVMSKVQTRTGDVFSNERFDADIRRLSESGFFTKVNWSTAIVEGGVKIIITVEETANIYKINFEGIKSISLSLIEKEMKLRVDGPLDTAALKSDENLISQKYKEAGYHFAEVSTVIGDGEKGKIVTFSIREGPYVRVRNVVINGNASFPVYHALLFFPKHPILGLMNTRAHHWYSPAPYQEKELYLDLERIKTFYRGDGWQDVEAFIEDVKFTEARDWVTVTVRIEEGLRYYVRNISVSGNTIVKTDEIMPKIRSKTAQPYQIKFISQDIQMIKTLYGKSGYIDCNVDIRTLFPSPAGTIDIIYDVSEGVPSYLGKVSISGNVKTREKVIRREMTINPGDLMDYGELRTSLDRIGATRYFQKLDYEIEQTDKPDIKNLHIKVEEGPTGQLRLGGGYSSNYGFGGILEFSQDNFDLSRTPDSFGDFFSSKSFAGGGQSLRIYWQPGVTTSQSGIQFTEPYLFNKPVELSVRYSDFHRNWIDYNEARVGGSLLLAYRMGKHWKIGGGPRFEDIYINEIESSAPAVIHQMSGASQIRAVNAFFEEDYRDSWLVPSSGYRWRLSDEVSGGGLGGDFNFTKRSLSLEAYTTPAEVSNNRKIILGGLLRTAQIQEFGDSGDVPPFERLYAGGYSSIRGFGFHSVSPKDDGVAVGGKVMATLNNELTYPLYSEDMYSDRPLDIVRFLLFYDIGNAAERWSELTWDTYRTSWGFGFRFQLGMIPISLSMAYPIKHQPDDDLQRIQLDLGFGF